jgi:NAD(P)-dependent dehydrogenase (short-subunit alcohol dehydrogenase family)
MKNVLIIGASGGIGSALQNAYNKNPSYELVNTLTRSRDNFDITNESNVTRNLEKEISIYDVIIVATGGVKINNDDPEKTIKRLNSDAMLKQFSLNALGPALVLKHIHKLIPKNRPCHVIVLSARVGSITDNHLGGWISYRTAKAALNQILRTSAIEIKRTHPNACLLAVHPGTVDTEMTKNYTTHPKVSSQEAANDIINLTETLDAHDSGKFFDWAGKIIPW